jgi:GT2 family glycosyltransferase
MEEMLRVCRRPGTGAVGAKLFYGNGTIQHAGCVIGMGGVAGAMFVGMDGRRSGYLHKASIIQDMSAVTAACMMIPRRVWDTVGGLDEGYAVAFNDVDLCMRIRKAGYLIAWTPWASLYHYEYKSRGAEDTPEKRRRYLSEILRFKQTWEDEINAGDPCYNPNLSPVREDFSSRISLTLSHLLRSRYILSEWPPASYCLSWARSAKENLTIMQAFSER